MYLDTIKGTDLGKKQKSFHGNTFRVQGQGDEIGLIVTVTSPAIKSDSVFCIVLDKVN